MRSDRTRYPVDRYLVDSSKKVEMVNIIDDEIWNPDPTLRPEDEIVLRKLHDMLQSTADDLKLLSGELCKFREPGVQIKSQPTPLDEEFNEKVHIEEIVNAKFHGYKIVDDSLPLSSESKPKKDFVNKMLASRIQKPKAVNASVQVNSISSIKQPISSKNLQSSRLKAVYIKEDNVVGLEENDKKNDDKKEKKSLTTVYYDEIAHNYVERKTVSPRIELHIQSMPSINIRSELTEQKVLNLDILPDIKSSTNISSSQKNVQVINLQYEYPEVVPPNTLSQEPQQISYVSRNPTIRKVSKISCESSESTNNISSEAQQRLKTNKTPRLAVKTPQKVSTYVDNRNKKVSGPKKLEKRTHLNLDEWKKKFNSVYGQQSNTKKKLSKTNNISPKKINSAQKKSTKSKPSTLNNAEYIPYSQLTLGGVRVSDIEREISDLPNKNDLPLSPILDRILSSRENSFHKDSPRINEHRNISNILTTSDENLLQEVIDIEKTISETFSKTFNDNAGNSESKVENESVHSGGDNSYLDDFEDEKSVSTGSSENNQNHNDKSQGNESKIIKSEKDPSNQEEKDFEDNQESGIQNATYIKTSNLSFKDGVDIFEFVHSVDTHETGTQSHTTSKISLKETQTSPRNDRSCVQPIHNDLGPPMDPKGEVAKLFQLEKEFIKKLIISEYGNILEENITKPSTSRAKDDEDRKKNISALQKNTQTSPAHVKCVMTSPTRTKTRTTSPFSLFLTVDRQTSPLESVDREELKILIDKDSEDHAISINLSSPRFSLKLPQNSREVISNLEDFSQTPNKTNEDNEVAEKSKRVNIYAASSSSSVGADNSSEISSLGEIKYKLRRKIKKSKVYNVVESSSSSMVSRSSDIFSGEILPLKSEGELSFGQMTKKPRGRKESDGELSSGAL